MNYKALKKIINSLQNAPNGNDRPMPPTSITIAARPPPIYTEAVQIDETQTFLHKQKASFFFRLERELEKVNTFYLRKENDFKVRLRTLIDKKKFLLTREKRLSAGSASITALKEAFLTFQLDLNKLQQFIEINATGFRKILKKWDKRSKSSTKELYFARQVESQPCFNRDTITELADSASGNIVELDSFTNGLPINHFPSPSTPERTLLRTPEQLDVIDDIETELFKAITSGPSSVGQEILERIRQHPEDRHYVSRVFWRVCSEGPLDAIQTLVNTGFVDFTYKDDISGRTCLHEAAIIGRLSLMKLCVEHGVQIDLQDVYGRRSLHYVAMYGHSEATSYLLLAGASVSSFDNDGFSPLIYAITNGNTECVKILLDNKASIMPQNEGDHIPLSLACQYGHKDIAMLLLDKGAKIIPDAEGLSPLHLSCREGHHELAKLLTEKGALLDTPDKYNGWTPIFYAASEGHIGCVKVLLTAGCQVNITDELGNTPIYYAAWEGHIECINLLSDAGGRAESQEPRDEATTLSTATRVPTTSTTALTSNISISDTCVNMHPLILPPPIIPLCIYGHNYLDKKYHVQVTLGHHSSNRRRPPVHLYGNSKISSLKLIISSKPDMGTIPHSVILPLGDDRELFSFQVDSLSNFSLEFDIFPTFGSRVIGKGVALPYMFDVSDGRERRNNLVHGGTGGICICPLFDTHLKVVGEVSFEFAIVKPFQDVRLEIGGRVETYWKSTNTITHPVSNEQTPPPPLGTSGIIQSFITATSLSGEYVQVIVQVTRDMVAVVYPEWMLPVDEFDLSVSDVTLDQFKSIGEKELRDGGDPIDFNSAKNTSDLSKMIRRSFLSLKELLTSLPASIGVNLEIKYPTVREMARYWFSDIPDINSYVDTILQTVYDHAQNYHLKDGSGDQAESMNARRIMFSSFNPAICTALNWKQPNYAVFFNSYCGFGDERIYRGKKRKYSDENKDDNVEDYKGRDTSIKEAVKFAKGNNLLGLICEATLLVQVPSLITYAKEAGLILTTFGTSNNDPPNVRLQIRYGVDALMVDGVIRYNGSLN
ncbi:10627_t:CDS:2 [Paraglomus brasilianum]|uniref:10627_t:CDS:1 n=1 Tax=Paraglomus brasilianum TaxID=144538 RepID=A0A9N9AP54_9GLOM|nr:10627_t:CDS:2 [Paraglomus brasilianum]